MTERIIGDLPGGWRGVVHDLAVSLGLAEPTQGEQEAARASDPRLGLDRPADWEAGRDHCHLRASSGDPGRRCPCVDADCAS